MPNKIKSLSMFSFFVTSYLPLFFLIIAKQVKLNFEYLNFVGFSKNSLITFISKFGVSFILLFICIFGVFGIITTLTNIKKNADDSFPGRLKEIKNISGESINYIATYIIPFVFQKFDLVDSIAIFILLLVIYCIYVKSNLIVINPLLSIKYSIYEVQFNDGDINRTGIIISESQDLTEGSRIMLYEFSYKIFYVKKEIKC